MRELSRLVKYRKRQEFRLPEFRTVSKPVPICVSRRLSRMAFVSFARKVPIRVARSVEGSQGNVADDMCFFV